MSYGLYKVIWQTHDVIWPQFIKSILFKKCKSINITALYCFTVAWSPRSKFEYGHPHTEISLQLFLLPLRGHSHIRDMCTHHVLGVFPSIWLRQFARIAPKAVCWASDL